MDPFEISRDECWFDMGWCIRASSLPTWPSPRPQEISLDGVLYSSPTLDDEGHSIQGRGWHYWSDEDSLALSIFK